jgi:hypothetical protein
MPDGTARGLVSADAAPPPGAATWARPEWQQGERFAAVQGELSHGAFVVVAIEPEAYVLDVGAGRHLRRDRDLGNLGEWLAADDAPMRLLSPVDVRYHWPLWVGKRWSCEFVDRMRGGPALPMRATYLVEGLDTVTVAGGTFEALRIVRTLHRLDAPGQFHARTQVTWYAPAVGFEVRQLTGEAVELTAHTRR